MASPLPRGQFSRTHLPEAGGTHGDVKGKWEEELKRAKVVSGVTHSPFRGTAVVVVKTNRSVGGGEYIYSLLKEDIQSSRVLPKGMFYMFNLGEKCGYLSLGEHCSPKDG